MNNDHTNDWDSSDDEEEFISKTQLKRIAETGEKESIVEESKNNLEQARAQVEEQKKIVERQKNLYETEFFPYQDYEISLSTLKVLEINVEIAESQLVTVQTGVKQEEINMISTQITALEKEIEALVQSAKDAVPAPGSEAVD